MGRAPPTTRGLREDSGTDPGGEKRNGRFSWAGDHRLLDPWTRRDRTQRRVQVNATSFISRAWEQVGIWFHYWLMAEPIWVVSGAQMVSSRLRVLSSL